MTASRASGFSLAAAALVSAAGCTALPPPSTWFAAPAAELAVPVPVAPRPVEIPERLTYAAALRIGLEENPGLEAARRRIARAEALVEAAKAASYPFLSVRGSYVRFIDAAQFRGRTGSDVAGSSTRTRFFTRSGSDIYNAGLDVRYPVFDGGAAYHGRREAEEEVEASRSDADSAREDLRLRITTEYLNVLLGRGAVEIAEQSLEHSRQAERLARARAEAGESLQVDALTFATRSSEERLRLHEARNDLRVRIAVLGELLGGTIPEGTAIEAGEGDLAIPEFADEAAAVSAALAARTEMRSLERRAAGLRHRIQARKASFWPAVNLFGSYGVIKIDDLKLSQTDDELQFGGSLTLPLYEGGGTRAQIMALEEERRGLLEARREMSLRIEREVREARIRLGAAEESVQVSAETVRLAEEVLERVDARYRAGETVAVDVTEAELRLFTARMAHLSARIEEALARARNLRALGSEY